jgi:hypothetical protein
MGAVSLKSPRMADGKTGDLRRLKAVVGKPAETGWRVLGVGYPALKGPVYDAPAAGEAM